jgi:hypothetical protein
MGIHPGLKTTEGTEVIVSHCPRPLPTRNSKPAYKRMARRLSSWALHLFTARITGKVLFLVCHLSPYPYNEQELQVVAEQLLQALPPLEFSEPSELRQNEESTRSAPLPQLGQGVLWLDWLMGLSSSNLILQLGQEYSYIGISLPLTGSITQRPLP